MRDLINVDYYYNENDMSDYRKIAINVRNISYIDTIDSEFKFIMMTCGKGLIVRNYIFQQLSSID